MLHLLVVLSKSIFCSPESNGKWERIQTVSRSVSYIGGVSDTVIRSVFLSSLPTIPTLLTTASLVVWLQAESCGEASEGVVLLTAGTLAFEERCRCYNSRIPIAQTPPLCSSRDSLWMDTSESCGAERGVLKPVPKTGPSPPGQKPRCRIRTSLQKSSITQLTSYMTNRTR